MGGEFGAITLRAVPFAVLHGIAAVRRASQSKSNSRSDNPLPSRKPHIFALCNYSRCWLTSHVPPRTLLTSWACSPCRRSTRSSAPVLHPCWTICWPDAAPQSDDRRSCRDPTAAPAGAQCRLVRGNLNAITSKTFALRTSLTFRCASKPLQPGGFGQFISHPTFQMPRKISFR